MKRTVDFNRDGLTSSTPWRRYSDLADLVARLDRKERLPLGTPTWQRIQNACAALLVHAALKRHPGDLAAALEIIDAAAARGPAGFDNGIIRQRFLQVQQSAARILLATVHHIACDETSSLQKKRASSAHDARPGRRAAAAQEEVGGLIA